MRHVYATSREKVIDLWLGFAAWFAVGGVVLLATAWLRPAFAAQSVVGILISVTAGAAVLLGLTRGYAAFGVILAVWTVLGLLVVEMPFMLLGTVIYTATGGPQAGFCANTQGVCVGPPSMSVPLAVGLAVFLVAAWFSLRGIHRRIR